MSREPTREQSPGPAARPPLPSLPVVKKAYRPFETIYKNYLHQSLLALSPHKNCVLELSHPSLHPHSNYLAESSQKLVREQKMNISKGQAFAIFVQGATVYIIMQMLKAVTADLLKPCVSMGPTYFTGEPWNWWKVNNYRVLLVKSLRTNYRWTSQQLSGKQSCSK